MEIGSSEFSFGRGRPPTTGRRNGKVDVVVWDHDDRPLAAIEVKSCVNAGSCAADLDRLGHYVAESNVQFGLMAYYQAFSAADDDQVSELVRRRGELMARTCEQKAEEFDKVRFNPGRGWIETDREDEPPSSVWRGLCFVGALYKTEAA